MQHCSRSLDNSYMWVRASDAFERPRRFQLSMSVDPPELVVLLICLLTERAGIDVQQSVVQ